MRNLNIIIALFLTGIFMTSCQKEALENPEIADRPTISTTASTTSETGKAIVSLTTEEGRLLNEQIERNTAENSQDPFSLKMDNGNELQFFPFTDDQKEDFFVLESGACQSCSALGTLRDLREKEYTARDIYWAFSKPGTDIPFQLMNQQSLLPQSNVGTQGWALEQMQRNNIASKSRSSDIACGNQEFRSSIAGGFLDGTTTVRYDKTPQNYSYFYENCLDPFNDGRCWPGDQRYSYSLRTSDPVRRWAGKVCVRAVETSYNDHDIYWTGGDCPSSTTCQAYFGPEITFERYYKGKWQVFKTSNSEARHIAPKNKPDVYSWWGSSDDPQYYRLKVKNALEYDEFDFMSDKEF